MSETVRVEIAWSTEGYPEMVVSDSPDRGTIEIPRKLLHDLTAAEEMVSQAQVAIARHVVEQYPEVNEARWWLVDNDSHER